MRKPWHTHAWKKKRSEFLRGKNCQWCGSEENLVIHHTKSFHGLQEYKRIRYIFLNEYFKDGKNEAERQELLLKAKKNVVPWYINACPKCDCSVYARKTRTPKYRCVRCENETDNPIERLSSSTVNELNRSFYSLFFKLHREEVDKLFTARKEKADKEYKAFKDVMILCKRCHYAIEKGLVLCEICKESYHKPKYGKCLDCFRKTEAGKEIARLKEPLPYAHPWCGNTFQIPREDWDITAEPHKFCMEYCEDFYQCELALDRWEAYTGNLS